MVTTVITPVVVHGSGVTETIYQLRISAAPSNRRDLSSSTFSNALNLVRDPDSITYSAANESAATLNGSLRRFDLADRVWREATPRGPFTIRADVAFLRRPGREAYSKREPFTSGPVANCRTSVRTEKV